MLFCNCLALHLDGDEGVDDVRAKCLPLFLLVQPCLLRCGRRLFGVGGARDLLGRGVDLVEPGAVRNPYVLASINRNRESVYAA